MSQVTKTRSSSKYASFPSKYTGAYSAVGSMSIANRCHICLHPGHCRLMSCCGIKDVCWDCMQKVNFDTRSRGDAIKRGEVPYDPQYECSCDECNTTGEATKFYSTRKPRAGK